MPPYQNYIDQRREQNKSTSRRDYYYDLFIEQSKNDRLHIANSILATFEHLDPVKTATVSQLIGQQNQVQGLQAVIPQDLWNADRLTDYLERMDT